MGSADAQLHQAASSQIQSAADIITGDPDLCILQRQPETPLQRRPAMFAIILDGAGRRTIYTPGRVHKLRTIVLLGKRQTRLPHHGLLKVHHRRYGRIQNDVQGEPGEIS